jgi:hypothetical protein
VGVLLRGVLPLSYAGNEIAPVEELFQFTFTYEKVKYGRSGNTIFTKFRFERSH